MSDLHPAVSAVELWMNQAPVGPPDELVRLLDGRTHTYGTEWGTGSASRVLEVLNRCVTHDHSSGDTTVGFKGAVPNQRLGDFGVESWDDKIGESVLRITAGPSFHFLAKVNLDRYALLVHSAGGGIQELAGKDQNDILELASVACVETGESPWTSPKEALQNFHGGSVERMGQAYNARKIYESDAGFHPIWFGSAEEQATLNDPSIKNIRLVWER